MTDALMNILCNSDVGGGQSVQSDYKKLYEAALIELEQVQGIVGSKHNL